MASSLLLPSINFPKPTPLTKVPRLRQLHSNSTKIAAKFNISEILGGRGLCKGEAGLRKFLTDPPPPAGEKSIPPPAAAPLPSDVSGFEKELLGLTGGFPGGEKGLQKFVQENPPPAKVTGSTSLAPPSHRPAPPELPLLMPGMIVIVKNPSNPYYQYCGTVQRVTDGMAGVLFEGGNWDKLLSFRLEELERREKGPPMVNPKSAVLETMAEENS